MHKEEEEEEGYYRVLALRAVMLKRQSLTAE
jgi:hypothetical protein